MNRSFPFLRTHKTTILKPRAASHTTIEIKKKDEYISLINKVGDKLSSKNITKAINSKEIKEDKICLNTKKKTMKAIKNINENIKI